MEMLMKEKIEVEKVAVLLNVDKDKLKKFIAVGTSKNECTR